MYFTKSKRNLLSFIGMLLHLITFLYVYFYGNNQYLGQIFDEKFF